MYRRQEHDRLLLLRHLDVTSHRFERVGAIYMSRCEIQKAKYVQAIDIVDHFRVPLSHLKKEGE